MLEKEFIDKCIEGDRAALEKLYDHYAPKLKGICLRYARTNFEADDIFQEAFIKIFKNIQQFQYQGSFDGWIRRIVVNTSIDYYKKNIAQNSHIPIENFNEIEFGKIEMVDDLSNKELLELISKLPEGYKMVFNLYAIDGYTHKEISEKLNITEGTSKSQLAKARKYLQKLLLEIGIEIKKSY